MNKLSYHYLSITLRTAIAIAYVVLFSIGVNDSNASWIWGILFILSFGALIQWLFD